MTTVVDEQAWARQTFGHAALGDKRRTARLVQLASVLAMAEGASTSKAHAGDDAGHEGAYRFLRNARNEPPRIAQSGFQATVDRVDARAGDLLAVEDTTTLGYPHDSPVELGDLGGPERSTMRGFHVQSVLLVDRESGATV